MSKPSTRLYVWGSDSHGQLGILDSESPHKTPQVYEVE